MVIFETFKSIKPVLQMVWQKLMLPNVFLVTVATNWLHCASGKLYPLKILEFYFELLLHYRIQEIKDSKSILDQKPTYFILQVLGF